MVSAVSTAFSIIAIRQLVASDDSRSVAAWTFILMTPPSLVLAVLYWTPPPLAVWPLLFVIGCVAAVGQLAMNRAFALAEASAVLPYDFVRFGLVTLFGITIFDERLDAMTIVGGIVIFAATVYLAVRERQVARAAATLPL
jgi:drug/metabolite transporter (DMT)-like permease